MAAADPLASYRAKRDPTRTAEPVPPAGQPLPIGDDDTFVVHEHRTPRGRTGERVHWDLRLERGGVLKSWAVPKGPPTEPGVNRLAVPTEDHPLEYASFSGTIAAGEYGAGVSTIWDAGRYAAETWKDDHVTVAFDGQRLTGRHVLFRLPDGSWALRKLDPDPVVAGPVADGVPEDLPPMLAAIGELPAAGDLRWGYEFKWDGVRALAHVRSGRVRLRARSGNDVTASYPELGPLPDALAGHDAVVDGEVVALDARGRPDFGLLQGRMHRTGPEVARLAAAAPVSYLVFDLLALDGESLLGLPYTARRERLDALGLGSDRWVTTPWFRGDTAGVGQQVQAASRENGLEGVVAKRLDSVYRPGGRGPDWRKVKNLRTQSVVVGGWRPGAGRRAGGIGSLLLGVHDEEGRLVFAGHVGTGFTAKALADLEPLLTPRGSAPFADPLPREVTRDAHWVEPVLVGEVAFTEWTREGKLRHPAWRGLREDVAPADVVVEPG
ncbi:MULTISPECIES: non-homologous end-joining DNA ligase [unclassified Modestobacter]|uniref:non-homologous end-joining DNA ligase n=1 Tax=unclassified Modestobacter TaxID=2643866 RepID=UPI0022AB222E|nr:MULTISPECIES: non-homologous end-joining DNA ligase [unclassified Modestobacter]MCZ2826509.1 non-homologous end-joining DNA ligase [Modestobacter sp. VKM Ac-2981]MCZ2852426.1 non-homologous end-joining DNA ligase [Modestobacter sp. VKM Ac-2982]